ncbi:MAG: cytochrome c biogenesis protein CcsA [Gemmatimonadetes bacterium]|nr:cytochrome c biogenesis protein CcsA [Gemmatimonadota bacterium]
MSTLVNGLVPWLPIALLGTTLAYLADFRRRDTRLVPLTRVLLAVSVALLALRFAAFVTTFGRPPLAAPAEGLGTIGFALALVYGILEALHGDRSAAVPLLGAATFFLAGAVFAPPLQGAVTSELLSQPWFGFHAITAILGYTAFAVGAVYATLYLGLYSALKRRRFGLFWDRMPPLDVLAQMAIRSATLGFVFLTLAIVAGSFGWARVLDHPAWQDPKVLATIAVWVVYAFGLSLYYFRGWRGIRCVGITLVAFVLMILSSWIVPLLLGSAHGVSGLS